MRSQDIARSRAITKKDVAFFLTLLTVFGGVLRYGEKRLDSVEAEAKEFAQVSIKAVDDEVDVEREERQENYKNLNAKLETITRILLEMRKR